MVKSLGLLSENCAKTKALLVITDGMDTASSASLKDAEEMSRNTNIRIYSIGIGNTRFHLPMFVQTGISGGISGAVDDRLDARTLNMLAQDTGGKTFVVGLDDDGASLKQVITAIADKIGNQYIVAFIGDGSTSQLRVEAPGKTGVTLKILTH